MKILLHIGALGKGGAERVMSTLANYLDETNNEVSLVINSHKKIYYKLNDSIKLYTLDKEITNKNFAIKNLIRLVSLKNIIKNVGPDVIISFLPEPNFRVLFLKLFNRKLKVIISVRNDPHIEYKSKIYRMIMKFLYPIADGFVFQTKEAEDFFYNKIQKKSIIIPNPITKKIADRKEYTGKKEKIIVSVGRLEEQKNHKMLINAFNKVKEELADYKLYIYGEGKLRKQLENQINDLNLKNRVFLKGVVDDIAGKIEKASLFILSSNYEGMPNALMEAMCLGLVCISTDCPCGGPKFLITDNENGFLVNVGDEIQLGEKIKKTLLETEKEELKKISNNARERALLLKENNICKMWVDYIKKVTQDK